MGFETSKKHSFRTSTVKLYTTETSASGWCDCMKTSTLLLVMYGPTLIGLCTIAGGNINAHFVMLIYIARDL